MPRPEKLIERVNGLYVSAEELELYACVPSRPEAATCRWAVEWPG